MSNPHRGEVTLQVGDTSYTLRYSANAICLLEEELDRGIVAIAQDMMSWAKELELIRFSTIRAVLWAAMQDHHPNIDLRAAGEIIMGAGGIAAVTEKISEALTSAFPDAETKDARPPKKKPNNAAGISHIS